MIQLGAPKLVVISAIAATAVIGGALAKALGTGEKPAVMQRVDETRDCGGGVTTDSITPDRVQSAASTYQNSADAAHIFLLDYSRSIVDQPSRDCVSCKDMKTAVLGRIRDELSVFLNDTTPPGGNTLVFATLGKTSFGPETFYRAIGVSYPLMPEPPIGWENPLGQTDELLVATAKWRNQWCAWHSEAALYGSRLAQKLNELLSTLEKRPAEGATNITSAVELILRTIPKRGTVLVQVFSDFEENYDGRGGQHTTQQLAQWCSANKLAFPQSTQVRLCVTTRKGTLTDLVDRWSAFFTGCGVAAEALEVVPLMR